MSQHEKLDYVEFCARDLAATKAFFSHVFGWEFTDYGPDYTAFANQGLNGGFFRGAQCSQSAQGGALLVFYSEDIGGTEARVIAHGGRIVRPCFDFPGGCRFHFLEPSGNEFAVWAKGHS